jgi:hypothetical protein
VKSKPSSVFNTFCSCVLSVQKYFKELPWYIVEKTYTHLKAKGGNKTKHWIIVGKAYYMDHLWLWKGTTWTHSKTYIVMKANINHIDFFEIMLHLGYGKSYIIIIICLMIGRNVKLTLSWVSGIKSKICTIEFIQFCQFVKGC